MSWYVMPLERPAGKGVANPPMTQFTFAPLYRISMRRSPADFLGSGAS
jgi:hypothetical protein